MLAVLLLFLSVLTSTARAESLPGLPVPFSVDEGGHWVLADDLPDAFVSAGAAPGWRLVAVDGQVMDDPAAVQRMVAAGPARNVRLSFQTSPPADAAPKPQDGPSVEAILVVPRRPLVHVEQYGLLPWPDDLIGIWDHWASDWASVPVMVDTQDRGWSLDLDTAAMVRQESRELTPRTIPEIFWNLSDAEWVITDSQGLRTGDRAWAEAQLAGAARVRRFKGTQGDHLLMPRADGLDVYVVTWPRATPDLPDCTARVPETCLAAGKSIVADLSGRKGARAEALRQLGVACANGVHRGCYEAVALEDERLAPQVGKCVEGDATACNDVARKRLQLEPEQPGDLVLGLLEYACELEGSGTLGERLRRLEDVGAGCMMLADSYDLLGMPDRALLNLDQACVLGRADACEEAADRRHQAFAARTVRECEDEALPVAASCVELGRLLQVEPVATATLDDFGAFLRGCSLGVEQGCIELGDYVDRWGIDHPRVREAESQLQRSCKQGEQRACLGAAHLLVRHDPRTEDYAEALLLFAGACESGLPNACVAGAQQRRIGKARKAEAPTQLDMWTQACDSHSAEGCAGLGERMARSRSTWADAYQAWTRSCDLGEPHACTELGQLVLRSKKESFPGEQSVDSYLSRGCENGDPEGCYWLAEDDLPRKGDPSDETYKLLDLSCEGEFGLGCATLAEVHLDRKSSFDDEIAARHLETACDNGHYDSCKDLGGMYLRGKGVERDRQKAKELLDRFRLNAPRKHFRFGVHVGLAYAAGGEAELVLPIPVGPAIAVAGSYSYIPYGGTVMALLVGMDSPDEAPDFQYIDATVRIYPNPQARGLYGAAGYHTLSASGGSLTEDLGRDGWSGRIGYRNDSKYFYTGLEMGIGWYGVVDLNDFDEDENGLIPLVLPTLGFSVGFAVF